MSPENNNINQLSRSIFEDETLYRLPPRVVVVLSMEWERVTDEQRKLLSKILLAVNITLDEATIICAPDFTPEQLVHLDARQVLIFADNSQLEIKPYTPTSSGGVPVLLADELALLDEEKKRLLWAAMKEMFGIG